MKKIFLLISLFIIIYSCEHSEINNLIEEEKISTSTVTKSSASNTFDLKTYVILEEDFCYNDLGQYEENSNNNLQLVFSNPLPKNARANFYVAKKRGNIYDSFFTDFSVINLPAGTTSKIIHSACELTQYVSCNQVGFNTSKFRVKVTIQYQDGSLFNYSPIQDELILEAGKICHSWDIDEDPYRDDDDPFGL